jgi:hypothetical protein
VTTRFSEVFFTFSPPSVETVTITGGLTTVAENDAVKR